MRHPLSLRYTFMWICLGISALLLAQEALLPLLPAPILRVQVVNKGGAGKLVASGIEATEEGGEFPATLAATPLLGGWANGRGFFRSADDSEQSVNQGPPKGQLVVDLSDRVLRLYGPTGSLKGTYELAVGQAGWETPIGSYKVLDMQRNPSWQHPITGTIIPPGEDNPLGAAWIGFISTKTSQIGFHGTPDESAIGQPVSHGCLRMRNADVLTLYPQIATGWPVRVQP